MNLNVRQFVHVVQCVIKVVCVSRCALKKCLFPPQVHLLGWWWAVGVAQHWVEGPGEVVGRGTAGVALRQGNQTGEEQEEQ